MTVKEQVKEFVHDVKRRISHHKHHRGESSTSSQTLVSDGSSQTAYSGPTSRPGSPDGTRAHTPEREFGSQPGPVTPERKRVLSTSSHKHSFFHKLRRKSSNLSIDARSGTPERESFPGVSQPNTPENSAMLSNPGTPESSLFGHGGARQRVPSTPSRKHNVLHKLRRKSSHFKSHSDSHAIEKIEKSHHTSLKELHEHEDVPQRTSEAEPVHDTAAGTAEKDSDTASNPPSIIVTGPPADGADPLDSSRHDEGDAVVPTEAPLEPAQSQVEEKGDSPQMPLGLDRDTATDTEEKHDGIQLNPPPVVVTAPSIDDPLEVPLSQVEEKVPEGSGDVVDQDTAGTEEKHDDIQSNPLPVVAATPSGTDIEEVVIDPLEAPLSQVEEVHEGSGGVVDPPQASLEHGHHSDIHSHSRPIIVTSTDTLGSTGEDAADSPEAPLSQDDESEVVVELPHDDNDASDTQHLSGEDVIDASQPLQVEASADVVDPPLAPSDEVPQPAHDIALDTAEKDIIPPVNEDQSETRSDISGTLVSPDSISGNATKVDSDSNSDLSPSAMNAPNPYTIDDDGDSDDNDSSNGSQQESKVDVSLTEEVQSAPAVDVNKPVPAPPPQSSPAPASSGSIYLPRLTAPSMFLPIPNVRIVFPLSGTLIWWLAPRRAMSFFASLFSSPSSDDAQPVTSHPSPSSSSLQLASSHSHPQFYLTFPSPFFTASPVFLRGQKAHSSLPR